MKKFWTVLYCDKDNASLASGQSKKFDSLDEAVIEAKRKAADMVKSGNGHRYDIVVAEAIQVAKSPVPDIEMVKIK